MKITRPRTALIALAVSALAAASMGVAVAGGPGLKIESIPQAQPKALGISSPNVLARPWVDVELVRGSQPLENPDANASHYGYYTSDLPMVPLPPSTAEKTKSEPDKNTYLIFKNGLSGPDHAYDYGTHFLFQGHEGGSNSYLTRVNLDADAAHKVTLLGAIGDAFFDGSSWNPFASRLLLTGENNSAGGGVWQATPDYPSTIQKLDFLGWAGYEGVQTASDGSIWLVADVGGSKGTTNTHARQPNSFVYRFVPTDRSDLTKGGVLQALQVIGTDGKPIVFHPGAADSDILSQGIKDLHTYGQWLQTRWVTVHDTSTAGGMSAFDANLAAKAAMATPFKRPENGVFRPGTGFTEFSFTETGDTDLKTEAGAAYGGFGGIFLLQQHDPSADKGRLRLVFRGDPDHTGLDNIAWFTKEQVAAVEDAGDTVHTQRSGLDSGFLFSIRQSPPDPVRFLAEGRDPSATIDSYLLDSGATGFPNEGDNEITGIHVSNGDTSVAGMLGRQAPHPFSDSWRVFWTQQHGDNVTFEILAKLRDRDHTTSG
jgi:hypothetical protein